MNLKGRRALVTGASSGIGAAVAQRFAAVGAAVVLVSEREADLNAVVSVVREAGGQAEAIVADFSRPEQVQGLIARAEDSIGPLDILVNNAGVGLGASLLDTTDKDLRFLFDVNFFALAELCREALERMSARRSGRILNVSSGAARLGLPGVSAYSATKGAVHTYTATLRMEARPYGVSVTEVLPISVRTQFFDNARGEKYRPGGVVQTVESVAAAIVRCAASARPPAELLPYRPVRLAFIADALLPGLLDRFLAKNADKK